MYLPTLCLNIVKVSKEMYIWDGVNVCLLFVLSTLSTYSPDIVHAEGLIPNP